MKIIGIILLLAWLSTASAADWSSRDEQACRRDNAGQFKYYVLSLSWSPEFCRSHPDQSREPQCRQSREFVVHGLWPQCESGYPQDCRDGGAADAIDRQKIYAFMPSDYLIRHEWDRHGTCTGLDRSAYFALTGELFARLKLPRLSGAPKADQIERLFLRNNPGLDADEIFLSCTESGSRSSSNTLDEVRICVDRDSHEYIRCENAVDTCARRNRVTVTPAP